jgi:hypothetical protein
LKSREKRLEFDGSPRGARIPLRTLGGVIMKRLIYLTLILFVLSAFAGAANQVVLTPGGNNLRPDTLYAGAIGYFTVSIANDAQLNGINLPFVMSGSAIYLFRNADGFAVDPPGVNFVMGIPGTRWMTGAASDSSCWDLGGTTVSVQDSIYPYEFNISGAASSAGLASGPLEDMLKIMYQIICWDDISEIRELCIDVQPGGDFIFTPGGTPNFSVAYSNDGCFPVSCRACSWCPVWDQDNPTTMTIDHCDTGRVTLSATDPEGDHAYYYLVGVTGGAGTATVDDYNGVVTYIPDPSDVGQPVVIEVETTDVHNGQGGCPDSTWTINVTVTNNAPTISCGNGHNIEGSGRLFKKFDITSSDPDSCDDIQYGIVSITPTPIGICSIDPVTGILSFYTDNADAGLDYEFCIDASDGINAATDCFIVTVCNCEIAGDIDVSYDVNIGDAVALVAYIFKGAVSPANMNWADVNADCAVNVADAVYLINFIFKGGPEPQVGCYY